MIVGDTHGRSDTVKSKAAMAKALGCNRMIIVGDFGLWPGYHGVKYLDEVNDAAREYNQQILALPGNHEDYDQWDKWFSLAPLDDHGFAIIRSNVRLTKKIHPFKMDGKRFYVCGGAVSIDRSMRVEGKSWWRNETFSKEDLASVEKYQGPPIDYLLTHDCSDFTLFKGRLKPDADSQANRQRIDRAISVLRPRFHFHGHMHERYEWVNTMSHGLRESAFGHNESEWNGASTRTYGLECDNERDSFVILDTGAQKDDIDKVYWPTEAILSTEDDGFALRKWL